MEANSSEMPGAERDDESGRYTDKYPPEDFLEALEAEGGRGGTMDVARRVARKYDRDPDAFYDTTYKKLKKLSEEGTIECEEVGRSNLWLLPD